MEAQAVSPTLSSAEALVRKLREDIADRTHDSVRNLDVSLADGSVIVSGRTSRYYYKQLTTRAVFDLISDLNLENRIEVDREA